MPIGVEERIGHAAADDQVIDLADEIAEHFELGRNLGAADHRRKRLFRDFRTCSSACDFLGHRAAGGRRQEIGDALGRGVGAVGAGKGVVDIDVAEAGKGLGEVVVVGFLARMEPHVLQQQHVAVVEPCDGVLGGISDAIRREGHVDTMAHDAADRIRQRLGDRLQGKFVDRLSLRPAQMRRAPPPARRPSRARQ